MLVDRNSYPFFAALASETRLMMIELLAERPMNIRDIAAALNLSSSIIAKHVQMMESAGIIRCKTLPGERGLQKLCSLIHDGFALNFGQAHHGPEVNVLEIPIGDYFSWSAKPPCGLATQESFIGYNDDVRSFADTNRLKAGLIWVSSGYLEYVIPNYMHSLKSVTELRIQMELCSEAPGWDVSWPSDIYFHVNDCSLGYWTAPGDYGDKPGLHSPEWYKRSANSSHYGHLKQIMVNNTGTYIDGVRTSDTRIEDLNMRETQLIRLKISSPENAANPRGFNLFGKGFGNYDQDIIVTMISDTEESAARAIDGGKEDT